MPLSFVLIAMGIVFVCGYVTGHDHGRRENVCK